jgi:hypothetical protein
MKTGKVSESIFSGPTTIIPMADVQHIEKHWIGSDPRTRDNYAGIRIITCHTYWNNETDIWANNIYLDRSEANLFLKAWCDYRSELDGIECPMP